MVNMSLFLGLRLSNGEDRKQEFIRVYLRLLICAPSPGTTALSRGVVLVISLLPSPTTLLTLRLVLALGGNASNPDCVENPDCVGMEDGSKHKTPRSTWSRWGRWHY